MRGAFMISVRTFLGYPYPLGATWMGNGVNFAIFSEHATGVELCLFDSIEATEENVPHSGYRTHRSGLACVPA